VTGVSKRYSFHCLTWTLMLVCSAACLPRAEGSGPSGVQESTGTPVPRVSGPCLAVQQDLWEAESSVFADLQEESTECVPGPVGGREQTMESLESAQSNLAIISGEPPEGGGELLRTESFVLATHLAGPWDEVTVRDATEAFSAGGSWLPVVVGEGQVAKEVLHIDHLAPRTILVSSWSEAKEVVIANRGAVALLPWELVDFRVRALAVIGQPTISDGVEVGVFERRWWLVGDIEAWPRLCADLREKLSHDLDPMASVVAVGDIMLGRGIASLMAAKSPSYPFLLSKELTRDADIAFGNLECPITSGGAGEGGFVLRCGPEAAGALSDAGFDIVSLANNHADDYGEAGLLDTVGFLQAENIGYVGAGEEAQSGLVTIEAQGLRVGFLAFNDIGTEPDIEAGGTMAIASLQLPAAYEEVQRAAGAVDFLVVSLHWGREYVPMPDELQQEVARGMLEAGASLIVGHHPHVVGPVAFEKEGLVAYSLGNFVFDQPFSEETLQGLTLRGLVDASGLKQVELVPVQIVNGQPVRLPRPEARAMLSDLLEVSSTVTGMSQTEEEADVQPSAQQSLQVGWSRPLPGQARALLVCNLDGEGRAEILVVAGSPGGPNSISALDVDGRTLWEQTVEEQINDLECGDLESDGWAEVVLALGLLDRPGTVVALDAAGKVRWQFGVEAAVLDVALARADGGSPEVAVGEWGAFGDTIYLLDREGRLLWKRPTDGSVHSVAAGDLNDDGREEVIAGADELYAVSSSGGLLWRYPAAAYASQVLLSSPYDFPTRSVALGLRYPDACVSVLDPLGNLVWRHDLEASPTVVLAEDIDPDDGDEVVVGALDGSVYLFDAGRDVRWSRDMGDPVSDLVLGDLEGDGGREIVVGTGDYFSPGAVYVLDSLTGSLLVYCQGFGQATYVGLNELDQGGGAQIVAASGSEVYLLQERQG
jgi:poly-gamma-glutamate capsule biosynthesis protein CapA/YwtB (metallophosphatase superfamily)/outer membrane protein assembly factor BamB